MPMEIILDKWISHVDHLNTQRIVDDIAQNVELQFTCVEEDAATESVEVLSVRYKPVS